MHLKNIKIQFGNFLHYKIHKWLRKIAESDSIPVLIFDFFFFPFEYLSFRFLNFRTEYLNNRFAKLDNFSNKNFKKIICFFVNKFYPKQTIKFSDGLLQFKSDDDLKVISNKLNEDGCFVFHDIVSKKKCEKILDFAYKAPCCVNRSNDKKVYYIKDQKFNPVAPQFAFDEQLLLNNETIQELVFDESVILMAQEYLSCKPTLNSVSMWWNTNFKTTEEDQIKYAQKFHYDYDSVKFLRFFVYINDISIENGPHCYVKGSHNFKPPKFKTLRRYDDEEVESEYNLENICKITGKAGTIITADTSGLHKGMPVISGERFMIEFTYVNLYLGPVESKIIIKLCSKKIIENKEKGLFMIPSNRYLIKN